MAGLYIHIPLCKSKCIYCDFYSLPMLTQADAIVNGLIEELEYRRNEIVGNFTTIYIGGGTPSVLTIGQLQRLVDRLPLEHCVEFTIEVNPDDVTVEKAAAWRRMGVNRVSMGVQTLHDPILKFIRRRHTSTQAIEAIATLRNAGFDNISCDLIYGLPGMNDEIWLDTLRRLLSQQITHLSAYCLTCYDDTPLSRMVANGEVLLPDEEQIERQFNTLRQVAASEGFEHYEISNFARPGHRSRHNSSYWQADTAWLGIGPSAHSFDGKIRRIDAPDTAVWLARLPYPCEIDEETDLDRLNDTIVATLRTSDGLDLSTIPADIACDILSDAAPFIASGHLLHQNNKLSIPQEFWLTADAYIRNLIRLD